MSYQQSAIDLLVARIGWAEPILLPNGDASNLVLSADNTGSTSGRTFDAFHDLVRAENVVMTMPMAKSNLPEAPGNDNLNTFLTKLKTQAALKVLNRLFDANLNARDVYGDLLNTNATDWTNTITDRISAFDEAYGVQVAYDTLNMMLTSTRLNIVESIIGSKGQIMAQANGIRDVNGKLITPGLFQRLEDAYSVLSGVLFPAYKKKPIVRWVRM